MYTIPKASQMWLFGRILPVLVGNDVPEDDEHWHNFLLLLQITDYLLAPKVTVDEVAYMELLIQQHHEAFVHLYPSASIIPKMHYMVHMPRIMIE